MGGCCGSKPAPSPRRESAVSEAEAEGQARVLALQAEKIKLLEEQVANLRQVHSASSSGSTPSPAAAAPTAVRGPEPVEPVETSEAPEQPLAPQGSAAESVDGDLLLDADKEAELSADEQVALANIDRLSLQVPPPAVDDSSLSPQTAEVSADSKLSTILSAGSQEQQSEPLSGSVWRGSYGSIGAAVDDQNQLEVQVDAVTVELDEPGATTLEDAGAAATGKSRRQQRRANANGFQMQVEVPDDSEVETMDADGGKDARSSVDSCGSAPGISPALSAGTMEDILAVAEESSQDDLALQAALVQEEESILEEVEASVVVEAESDMAVLAAAAEKARLAEQAVVAKRGEHSPISKSTSAKRREIERMLAEAHAEVSALKAQRDGLLDEEDASAVLSYTPPRSNCADRADWHSDDSSSEDSVHVIESDEALEVEDGFDIAALDLEAAALVVGSEEAQQGLDGVGAKQRNGAIKKDWGAEDEDGPEAAAVVSVFDEAAIATDLGSPDGQTLAEHQDHHEEQLRLARMQAREDRRVAKEREERAKAAAEAELELGALVANAEVAEEEDPVAAAKRAKMLERMAKRSEERAEKMRQAKEERVAARAAARAVAAAAEAGPKKSKKKGKKTAGQRNKAPKAKELDPSEPQVDAAMEALQAGNRQVSAAIGGNRPRPASGSSASATRRTGRSARPASAGEASAPKKKQAKVAKRPASGGGRAGGTVKTSKAVLAVQEMERKREARRAKALGEKNRRAAELAEHGDVKSLHYRRQLDEFRQQLSAGKSGMSLPKYRQKADSRVKVCVRKRPLLRAQQEDTAFDVLSTIGGHTLLCHEPREGVDGRQTFEHHPFLFDAVFGDGDGGAEVYDRAVGPEVEELLSPIFSSSAAPARGGGPARLTVFAYGQTGSGKTYTMGALTEAVLGRLLDAAAGVSATGRQVQLGLSYYEIYMAKPYDLLNGRSVCKTQEDGSGQCHITGLQEVPLEIPLEGDAEDDRQATDAVATAMQLLEQGARSRTTAANGVHDASSRSHAIIKLRLRASAADTDQRRGRGSRDTEAIVSLVDLAGSERASETKQDDAATRLEGAEINKSLLALKECIRALDSAASHTPFRQSVLTQILREGLEGLRSKTVMLATLSPAHRHAEHTLNTLRYAARLKELPQAAGGGRR